MSSVYDFEALSIDGKPAHLSTQRGKVLLIVNTASACGFTPQFAGLEELWKTYADKGLVVVGFPSNEFGGQDPGANAEIASFCQLNYGVDFPMMAKVEVNGAKQGREMELHQVPDRPRRQGDQALFAHRHAGGAEEGHRSGAGREMIHPRSACGLTACRMNWEDHV
jgi:Glutathione peroxidase